MKVSEIMSRPVHTVTPATPLKDAARLLTRHRISALPVLSAKGSLVGIISHADLVRAVPPVRQTVADVMTRRVLSVHAISEVSQAARTMIDAGVKRVPVLSCGQVVGMVSRRDLMRVIARADDGSGGRE